MKMQIVGMEGSSGVGKTSGKAYAMGQIHTLAKLAEPFSAEGVSKGLMGTSYRCPLPLIMKIKHLTPPFMAEVDVQAVMKFGKREDEIFDVSPITVTKATA